jgi:hypothetical protein
MNNPWQSQPANDGKQSDWKDIHNYLIFTNYIMIKVTLNFITQSKLFYKRLKSLSEVLRNLINIGVIRLTDRQLAKRIKRSKIFKERKASVAQSFATNISLFA